MVSTPELVELQRQLTGFRFEQWRSEVLFTPQWWLLIILLFAPWYVWVKLVDRRRILEITTFGALTMILITMLDGIGMELGLWSYKYKIAPLLPLLLPMDLSVLAVTHMLIYQYFRPWSFFLAALVIAGCLFAFAGEPFMEYIDVYQRYGWEHWYSLPIYIGKAIVCRLTVTKLIKFGQAR